MDAAISKYNFKLLELCTYLKKKIEFKYTDKEKVIHHS